MNDYPSGFNSCRVDLGALARNYRRIADYSGCAVMGVVKGDAYGHGLIPCGEALAAAGCRHLGVLDLEEALALKRSGIPCDVSVLSGLHGPVQSLEAVEAGVAVFAYDPGQIAELAGAARRLGVKARIRIKLDTGMGRLGIPWEKAARTVGDFADDPDLEILGLATHLATNGDGGAAFQLERFLEVGGRLADRLPEELRHSVTASGGILAHRDFPDDLRRAGLMLYGYSPIEPDDPALADKPEARELVSSLEPVMTVASRLIQIREARPGETIGYDRTYEVEAPTRFGTAPIGYVHGLSLTRSSLGHALIGGREAGILGRVCMNLTMWDLRGNDARVGDEVVLVGRQGDALIGADRLAGWQRTSAYEILCHLGRANPRVYVRS